VTDIEVGFIRQPKHAIEAAKFLDSFLGDGLHSPEVFLQWATKARDAALVGAFEGRRLLGASSCKVGSLDDWKDLECFEAPGLWQRLQAKTVGILESTAVLPQYRGRGLGRRMAELRIEFLAGVGCRSIIALSWDNGTAQQSRPLLTSIGFVEKGYVRDIWEGQPCPFCGESCHCDGWLMEKFV
jgi:GNAT superfamily N-acetyltransferase